MRHWPQATALCCGGPSVRDMITLFRRLAIGLCVLLVLLNFSWIRAASAAAVSEPCDASLLNQAEQRVAAFFGTTKSKPWIRCPVRPRLGVGAGIGATFISPGLPSVILLGPDGAGSVDVIAHEWAHAEIAQRVGGLRRNLLMPVWFDEGLAMQVDWRAHFETAALRDYLSTETVPGHLDEIASQRGFHQPGRQGSLHYALSKCVVGKWLQEQGGWRGQLEIPAATAPAHLAQCLDDS